MRAACPWQDGGPEAERLTYFELATALALHHFAEERVEAAVLEVGLGGRFDATNVVRPVACAVSRIGIDHAELLGGTLDAIAREKGGIFKAGVPAVVTAEQPEEALAALREEAALRGAPFQVAPADYEGPVGLPGPHQRANAALAACALRLLRQGGVPVPEEALARGIATARWPGRLETVAGVLLDGAHNPDGALALARALGALHPGRPVELVFGVLSDKDHATMLRALVPGGAGVPPGGTAHAAGPATRHLPRPGQRGRGARRRARLAGRGAGLRPRGGRGRGAGVRGRLALPGGRGAGAAGGCVMAPPASPP